MTRPAWLVLAICTALNPSPAADPRVSPSPKAAVQSKRPFAVVSSRTVPEYEWVSVTPKAAVRPARRGRGADVQGPDVAHRRVEPGRQEALPPRLQQRGLEFGRRQGLGPGEAEHVPRPRPSTPTKDWEGRHTAGYVVHRDKMWIVGGDVNQGHYHDDVWSSADGKAWTLRQPGQAGPVGAAGAALHRRVQGQDLGDGRADDARSSPPAGEVFYRDVWTSADGVDVGAGQAEGAVLAAAGDDRRGGGAQRPHLGPRRRHLRHPEGARPASSTTTSGASADGVAWERHASTPRGSRGSTTRSRRSTAGCGCWRGTTQKAATATTCGTRPTG